VHFLLFCGPFLSKDHFLWNRNHNLRLVNCTLLQKLKVII
jgi:hypothetical protein